MHKSLSSIPIWQKSLFQQWQQFVDSNKIPHAILIHGIHGLGKSQLVKSMLQYCWCESQSSCGQCRHCRWLLQDTHPDCQWLRPEASGKAIKIDKVRESNAWLQLSSLHAKQKVLVIQSAEYLNVAASNALLKTLEEPPEMGIIILISEMPQQLLATVRSRCYKMLLTTPDENYLKTWLKEHIHWDEKLALPQGLGPYALLEAFSEEKKQSRETIWNILENVSNKKIHFLLAAEKLKEFLPIEILNEMYSFMMHQLKPENLDKRIFEFESHWLLLKRSLLNHVNLNWQLQLELILEKL